MERPLPRLSALAAVLAAAAAVLAAAPPAAAQEVTASGSVGAGMFGAQPASTVELGVDLAGESWALGLGGQARWLAGDGFHRAEWDEASELAAGVIRYGVVSWQAEGDGGEDGAAASAALGELGGASLGHGAVIDGYAAGLHADHGHLGLQLRGRRGRLSAEALVDDVIAPRIGGLRAALALGDRYELGAQVAGDRAMPAGMSGADPGPAGAMAEHAAVLAAGLDGEVRAGGAEDRASGALTGDAVALLGLGAGVHLGARGDVRLGDAARLGARAELRAGTGGYLPGWIGPLYERDRHELSAAGSEATGQLEVARAGGLGGVGGLGGLDLEVPGAGSAALSWAVRRGVGDLVSARIAAPYRAGMQAGLWAAAELRGGAAEALALAAEVRVRLPRGLFARGEAARLYRDDPDTGGLEALWTAQISVGAVLGESDGGGSSGTIGR